MVNGTLEFILEFLLKIPDGFRITAYASKVGNMMRNEFVGEHMSFQPVSLVEFF